MGCLVGYLEGGVEMAVEGALRVERERERERFQEMELKMCVQLLVGAKATTSPTLSAAILGDSWSEQSEETPKARVKYERGHKDMMHYEWIHVVLIGRLHVEQCCLL
ncbi:hypothetical protein VNO78_11724 [Psophocarpus tetragonolobus]|uniref:Uncharacterized protein n=1 Tax=Psophocarpus tetragonolobus TaxID=3891 RepID=A0AAN9SPL5_PSOTE